MDRYDRIIRDVQQKTDDETIRWMVVNAERYSDVLLNTYRVLRAFTADYRVGKKGYVLLFVERKVDSHDDFGDSAEGYGFELFVLDEDGQIVLALSEGVVDRDDLLKLSGLIDEHNDRVKDFFNAFDEPGAA
jgi:hypothetical protein